MAKVAAKRCKYQKNIIPQPRLSTQPYQGRWWWTTMAPTQDHG